MRSNTGFTLVEVMVVIAIIGVLSAIIYPVFNDARDDARNKAIMTELKEMQLALEVYKSQNGAYPDAYSDLSPCSTTAGGANIANNNGTSCAGYYPYINDITPEYIGSMPEWRDSGNDQCNFEYKVEAGSNSWFKLTAEECFVGAEEASEGIQLDTDFGRCPSSCTTCTTDDWESDDSEFYESMAVYSPGGECQ